MLKIPYRAFTLVAALWALCLSASAQTVTPRACVTTTVVTGGTAVTIITGPLTGGYLVNPATAADQGIGSAENLYVDPINPATTTGNQTNSTLSPGQGYNFVPMQNSTVTVNAATSGHKFTCARY